MLNSVFQMSNTYVFQFKTHSAKKSHIDSAKNYQGMTSSDFGIVFCENLAFLGKISFYYDSFSLLILNLVMFLN